MSIQQHPKNLETIADYVRWAASQFEQAKLFYGHGSDNALDEAYHVVTASLYLPHDIPTYMMNARLSEDEKEHVFGLILQRVTQRIPVPYLLNKAWFSGLEFFVDERVLIPRSPIAELIQDNFSPWIDYESVEKILDVCTGSGCIAIACANYFPDAHCTASDISPEVLKVAEQNVSHHKLENRVELLQSDMFTHIDKSISFDIIISNPPYVDAKCMVELPPEYRHEPRSALAADEDGLTFVKQIIAEAKQYLSEHGILIVEVGNSRQALINQYPQLPFTWLEFQQGGDGVFLLTKQQLP